MNIISYHLDIEKPGHDHFDVQPQRHHGKMLVTGDLRHYRTYGCGDDEEDEIVQAKFLLKYLVLFSKAYNLSNTVEIFLKNDYPMVLKYSIADLGTLKFCLAPMVEED